MDFCDYGSLVRPILKGMFRPISSSGNDREARVRYRALLRTAKEIAQVSCCCHVCKYSCSSVAMFVRYRALLRTAKEIAQVSVVSRMY